MERVEKKQNLTRSATASAGAAWIVKRGHKAVRLELGQLGDGDQVNAAAAVVLQGDNRWTNLKALKVVSTGSFPNGSKVSFHSAVTWLLGNAKKLTFLRIELDRLRFMPHLVQLRHLQLTVAGGIHQLSESLGNLVNLQTIFLEQGVGLGSDARPHLPLAGCPHLQSVMMRDVVPASMSLPHGAALHLFFLSMEDARQDVWLPLAPAMQSVYIVDVEDGGCIAQPSDIPGFLTCLRGPHEECITVILNLKSWGAPDNHIEICGALLQSFRLVLQCTEDLCAHVPAGKLPWHVAKFMCGGTLNMTFDSVGDFLDSCAAFSFAYRHLQGLDMVKLIQGIGERSIEIESDYHDDEGCEFHSVSTPYPFNNCFVQHTDPVCVCLACPWCSDKGLLGPDARFPKRDW